MFCRRSIFSAGAWFAWLAAVALALLAATGRTDDSDRIEHESLPYVVSGGKVDPRTYVGWRLFHSTCHICHGVDATGTTVAPDLTERVRTMTPEEFIVAVLYRYPIISGFEAVPGDDLQAVREAFIEDIKKHERGDLLMPTWNDDPNVKPHVLDLYAYLRARADGALGTGRPGQIDP